MHSHNNVRPSAPYDPRQLPMMGVVEYPDPMKNVATVHEPTNPDAWIKTDSVMFIMP